MKFILMNVKKKNKRYTTCVEYSICSKNNKKIYFLYLEFNEANCLPLAEILYKCRKSIKKIIK